MKTAQQLGNTNSFSKGKIIVLGNNSSSSGITALKSKFANTNPSIYYDGITPSVPSFQQAEKTQQNTEESDDDDSDEEYIHRSSRFHNVQSTINTTNSSLNTTFSGFYHKLIGREKRRPQCTPPIRTVVSVGFLKEHYEKQVELEKQRQQYNLSKSQTQQHEDVIEHEIIVSKKNLEQHSTKPKVSWEDDPPTLKNTNTSRKTNQIPTNEQRKSSNVNTNYSVETDLNWTEMDIDRRPSLGPVMRSVYIRKESLIAEEESTRTRFVGEVDNRRNYDLDWKSRQEIAANKPRKSNIPSRPTSSIPKPKNVSTTQPNIIVSAPLSKSNIEENQNEISTQPKYVPKQGTTQSKRLFIPTRKPNVDREEEEEPEVHHIEQPMKADRKSLVQKNNEPQILDENSMEKFKYIARWIEYDLGIDFHSNIQCENDLRTGLKFAEIVARIEGEGKMKGINKLPQTTAAMHNNLERVFSVLRDNKTIELRFLWSTKEVISGDYETIWGLLNDIYNAYWKKTSKVKRTSQNKKRENNSRIQTHSPNSSMEEEREDENDQEGFSIDDINRMKRELLESSQDY